MNNNYKTKTLILVVMMLSWAILGIAQVNLESGQVLNLPFEGNANDNNVSFLTGNVVNAVLTEGRLGDSNSAYAFNGTDAYIAIPHSEVYNFGNTDPFTISVWVKQATNQNDLGNMDNDILSKWTPEFGGNIQGSHTGGYPFVMRNVNQTGGQHGRIAFARWDGYENLGGCATSSGISTFAAPNQPDSVFNDNQWHHYVFRKIASNGFLNLWVDGVDYGLQDDDSGDGGGCHTQNGSPLIIGARHSGNNHFTGVIDDLIIWDRTLNEEEIMTLYSGVNSIENALALNISLLPNPTSGHVVLSSPIARLESLNLYDITGRRLPADIVVEQHSAEIHCQFNGIAILRAKTNKGMIHQKVVFH